MLRSLLALLLAVPSFAQVRVVPAFTVPSSPASAVLTSAAPPTVHPFSLGAAPALSASVLPAAATPQKPVVPSAVPAVPSVLQPPARTAANLRDDADRLYASLAAIHSRVKAGEKDAALADLKRAFLGDFDGVARTLSVAGTGDELRAKIKELRRERAKAAKALDKAPTVATAKALAEVSGDLAAHQLKAARELLTASSPVGSKAWKRNAALWSLVGAHNSAAAAAIEGDFVTALARGEETYGDGRPYLVWNRWRNLHAELDAAARDARNGRRKTAASRLVELAGILTATGDAQDAAAARALRALAAKPESEGILSAKSQIAHPELKARTAVRYEDMAAGLRSMVHTLESGRADYMETAAAEASLRRAALLLSSPRPTASDKKAAKKLAAGVAEWAGRGRVEAKRTTATNVNAAAEAAERGDFTLAARHLGWAADALSGRRDELERIGRSVRRRLLSALGA